MRLYAVLITCCFLLSGKGVYAQELYEWNCSPLNTNNDLYTLPALSLVPTSPRSDYLPIDANDIDEDVDIYSVPPTLNCTGTVSAVRFCYFGLITNVQYNTEYLVFRLMTLEQSGLAFKITNTIDVYSTPIEQNCLDVIFTTPPIQANRYCCDSMELNSTDQFTLPRTGFAFGIMPASSTLTQLRYNTNTFPQYQVEHFVQLTADFNMLSIEDNFMLSTDNSTIDGALRLFQFFITTTTPTVVLPTNDTTDPTAGLSTVCGTQDQSNGCSTTESTTVESTQEVLSQPDPNNSLIISVTASIVGVIGMAVLITLVGLCILVAAYRKKTKASINNTTDMEMSHNTPLSCHIYDYVDFTSLSFDTATAARHNGIIHNSSADEEITTHPNTAYDGVSRTSVNLLRGNSSDVGSSGLNSSASIVIHPNQAYAHIERNDYY